MTNILLIIIGIVLLLVGLFGIIAWWYLDLWILIKGAIGPILILAGLGFAFFGFSELKSKD